MTYAHAPGGIVERYPYALRPDAKRLYPEVTPLPGEWSQCSPEQLAALNAVPVEPTAQPELQPGESVREGAPAWDGDVLRQTWEVIAAPPPVVPDQVPAHHFFAALDDLGLTQYVNGYIAQADARTQMYFNKAPHFSRDAAGIEAGRVALGLTHEQVDALFIAAGEVLT